MLSDERVQALRAKAQSKARGRSVASLLTAAAKADKVRSQVRSEEARTAFAVLAEVYRAEIERRRALR